MLDLLRSILDAIGRVLAGQKAISDTLKVQADAIEHLRVLIEGDPRPNSSSL